MRIQLMIKGTVADAEAQLDARGFHPIDRLTGIIQHEERAFVYCLVQVSLECDPGTQRWMRELHNDPPFPPGSLVAYTITSDPKAVMVAPLEYKPDIPLGRDFDKAVAAFVDAAQLKVDAHYLTPAASQITLSRAAKLHIGTGGTRYVRIYNDNGSYCFVDRTNGNVLKAKTWKAPDLNNPRANIYDDDHGVSGVDWHGAIYLR